MGKEENPSDKNRSNSPRLRCVLHTALLTLEKYVHRYVTLAMYVQRTTRERSDQSRQVSGLIATLGDRPSRFPLAIDVLTF